MEKILMPRVWTGVEGKGIGLWFAPPQVAPLYPATSTCGGGRFQKRVQSVWKARAREVGWGGAVFWLHGYSVQGSPLPGWLPLPLGDRPEEH